MPVDLVVICTLYTVLPGSVLVAPEEPDHPHLTNNYLPTSYDDNVI